jgi:hypothetical protein
VSVVAAYCHSRGWGKKGQVCGLDVDAAAVVQHDADACRGGVEAGPQRMTPAEPL